MSKKFKSQASSTRAANATFGSSGFGFGGTTFRAASSLSYVSEPPDLSNVSDPNVVVSLRNLGKKDSTTKAKALEELQEHVKIDGPSLEDSILTAWIELYPRTSIDNSRRVRQLAHCLQGALTIATGKRIAALLSKAIGPWLCGLYDNDRAVSRAAQDALSTSFASEEKRSALWKVYKEPLLDYVEDAILVQTTGSLSDERSTSRDDAEAKHVRVVGSAMFMFSHLIQQNQRDEKSRASYILARDRILANKKMWEFVHHGDPYLRRSACSLAAVCAQDFSIELDWGVLSTAFVSKGLQTSQLGSAAQFSKTLLALTKIRPGIWTSDYHANTPSSKRLIQFLRRGSQRGTEDVWSNTCSLFEIIPLQVFANSDGEFGLENASALAEALREGVTSSEELRQNLSAAWSCYVGICLQIEARLDQHTDRDVFYELHLLPVIKQYVDSSSAAPPASVLPLVSRITLHPLEASRTDAFGSLWSELGNLLMAKMKLSLPETSKDFASSQEEVIKLSERLFKINKNVLEVLSPTLRQQETPLTATAQGIAVLDQFNQQTIAAAISLLKTRNGKPFGAAAVLQDVAAVSNLTNVAKELLESFMSNEASQLMQSPSGERLVKLATFLGLPLGPLMHSLTSSQDLNPHGERAFAAILSMISQEEADSFPEIGLLVMNTLNGESSDPVSISFSSSLLRNPNLSTSSLIRQVTQATLDYLSSSTTPSKQHGALVLLHTALSDPRSSAIFTPDEHRSLLLSRLLVLADSPDSAIATLATNSVAKLTSDARVETGGSATSRIVAEQILGAVPQLPILSLVELAIGEYNTAIDKSQAANVLVPNSETWSTALEPHMSTKRPYSLSITSLLHGAVYLVTGNTDQMPAISHDAEGLSQAFRLALYVTRLMAATDVFVSLHESQLQSLFHHYPVALQLINEKVTLDAANYLWVEGTEEVLDEAADILSQGNSILQDWAMNTPSHFLASVQSQWDNLHGTQWSSYYTALALTDIANKTFETGDFDQMFPKLAPDVKQLHRSDEPLKSAALAGCFRDYILTFAAGRRSLNEFISDATEIKLNEDSVQIPQPILLLNILLNGDSEPLNGIQSQRLVFMMQNLMHLLESTSDRAQTTSEILKLLCSVLPAVDDIYGDHWQQVLGKVVEIWEHVEDLEVDLPVLHSSLRMYQKVKTMAAAEDANEDLLEAWTATKRHLDTSLLRCLWQFEKPSEGVNQPRQITAELLGRLLGNMDIASEDVLATMRLLASHDDAVSVAAFGLLHRAMPKRQSDLSMELLLEKQIAHLPAELLSIISDEAPTSTNPSAIPRRYFLCWKLLFDHFPAAAYKLREVYVADLKAMGQLSMLLDSICEAIRITSGRPLDASKVDFLNFELSFHGSEEKETQRLSMHLYYCSLLYVPGLVKAWFIEQRNRVRSPLEAWTQKYISPAIVAASLDSVTDWAKTQDPDDTPVEVKSNARSRELIASMAIDAESPPIAISVALPGAYPLESPIVTGRTRVGVSDKNWQSWIRTFQIIIFTSGSIIDGLVAFRRNTLGALKGQGECAICYSIIGSDMKTPEKKCATCKNTFHSLCLLKWFRSSNSSTCPLCRNNFSYA